MAGQLSLLAPARRIVGLELLDAFLVKKVCFHGAVYNLASENFDCRHKCYIQTCRTSKSFLDEVDESTVAKEMPRSFYCQSIDRPVHAGVVHIR